jgi:hypothetical protein
LTLRVCGLYRESALGNLAPEKGPCPASDGATNRQSPTFDPETKLFYLNATPTCSIFHLTAEGFAGRDENLSAQGMILAIDYRTGFSPSV